MSESFGQLVASLLAATGNLIFWPIVVGLGFLCWGAIMLLLAGRREVRSIAEAATTIRELVPEAGLSSEHLTRLERSLPENSIFQAQWKEFREGCVEHEGRVHNTLSAAEFITDDMFLGSIRARLWPTRAEVAFPLIHSVPGALTGLGILGTFLGVTLGLGRLAQQEGEDLLRDIGPVIGALSSAFWTSIFGVVLAIGFGFALSRREAQLLEALYDFREALDRCVPRITAASLLRGTNHGLTRIHHETEVSRGLLQTISEDLADQIGDRFSSALGDQLAPALVQIMDLVRDQTETARDTTTQQAQRFTDQMVERLAGSLSQSFEGMTQEFDATAHQISGVADTLRGVVDGATQAVTDQRALFNEGADAVRAAHQRSEAAADQLALTEEVAVRLGGLVDAVAQKEAGLRDLQVQQANLSSLSTEAARQAGSVLESAAGTYSSAAQQLNLVMTDLGSRLAELIGRIRELGDRASNTGDSLLSAGELLNSRISEERELLEGFGSTSRYLESTLREAEPLLRQLTATSELVAAVARDLSEERTNLRERHGELTGIVGNFDLAAQELTTGLLGASSALQGTAEDMKGVAAGTAAWKDQAEAAIQSFADGVRRTLEESLAEYDRSLSDSVGSLKSAMTALEDLAEEIAEGVERRRSPPDA